MTTPTVTEWIAKFVPVPRRETIMLTDAESQALFERDKALLAKEFRENQRAAARRTHWSRPWELGSAAQFKSY